jgi:helicase
MKIDDLIKYGFTQKIIRCLKDDRLKYLLPLQAEAVQAYGILQGKSLLISGPASSGKTLCGELAAIRSVLNNRKAIYLVPLKALAAEKYRELKTRYRRAGLKIIIVTSDYPENKKLFEMGEFDLAVVIYEMLNSLTATSLSLMESLGAVIFDEFQLICSIDRGLSYEMVLSKIRQHPARIQIVGLIGGLDQCDLFANWLDMPLLKSNIRPVELYRGVLCEGKFLYRRFNDCLEGTEYFTGSNHDNNPAIESGYVSKDLMTGVKYLVKKNEQVLIFVATRNECQRLALSLAKLLSLPAADRVIAELDSVPDTLQKNFLIECLQNGIGFHNADLSLTYRKLLEDGFNAGEIRILISTTTLALGVNMPSRNVFIEAYKCYDGFNGETVLKPMLTCDYNQIAGRAGRLGKTDEFGRAILIADNETRREMIWDSYIYGSATPEIQPFDTEKTAALILKWIACGLARDFNDIQVLYGGTLRGHFNKVTDHLPAGVIELLSSNGFIEIKGCRFVCTGLGKIAVKHNIDLNTATIIKNAFHKYDLQNNILSLLFIIADTPAGEKCRLTGRAMAFADPDIGDQLIGMCSYYNESPTGPLADLIDNADGSISAGKIKTIFLFAEMIQPIRGIELELKYNLGWGRIKHLGEMYAHLLHAAADIGEDAGLDNIAKQRLLGFAECLYHALPSDSLNLARLRVPILERDFILRLNDSGIYSPSDIVGSGYDIISSIIPEKVAEPLYARCRDVVEKANAEKEIDNQSENTVARSGKPQLRVKRNGGRYELSLNGVNIFLQPRLYAYFLKLYNADHPEGWLDKSCLDSGINQVKYIYRLRKALSVIPGIVIESDRAGRYRICYGGS